VNTCDSEVAQFYGVTEKRPLHALVGGWVAGPAIRIPIDLTGGGGEQERGRCGALGYDLVGTVRAAAAAPRAYTCALHLPWSRIGTCLTVRPPTTRWCERALKSTRSDAPWSALPTAMSQGTTGLARKREVCSCAQWCRPQHRIRLTDSLKVLGGGVSVSSGGTESHGSLSPSCTPIWVGGGRGRIGGGVTVSIFFQMACSATSHYRLFVAALKQSRGRFLSRTWRWAPEPGGGARLARKQLR